MPDQVSIRALRLEVQNYPNFARQVNQAIALKEKLTQVLGTIGATDLKVTTNFSDVQRDVERVTASVRNASQAIEQGISFNEIKNSIRDSLNTASGGLDTLKKKTEEVVQKPTISRYWETEAEKIEKSVNKINNSVDSIKSYVPGQPLGFTLPPAPPAPFADTYKPAFGNLEDRLKNTQSSFRDIIDAKSGKGQFDVVYQGAFAAEKKVNDLTNRIRALKKESADPANSKYFEQYKNGIREAEAELSRLEKTQDRLSRANRAGGGRRTRGLGETGRAILEVADDFVPAGLNKPFNAVVKEVAKIESLSVATLGVVGAIAAAGYGIVKWSEKVRDDAARRLKYEEQISAAINKQIIGTREIISSLEKRRELVSNERSFADFLSGDSLEELKKRRDVLKSIYDLSASRRSYVATYGTDEQKAEDARLVDQITALDARIRQIPEEKNRQSAINENKSFEAYIKDQEDTLKARFENTEKGFARAIKGAKDSVSTLKKLYAEAQTATYLKPDARLTISEQIAERIEQENKKIKEYFKDLKNDYESTFASLSQKLQADNPFTALRTESEKALESIDKLPESLRNVALGMQKIIDEKALFSARLDNALEVSDLRDAAENFRNPFRNDLQRFNDDPAKAFKDLTDFYIKQLEKSTSGSFTGYAKDATFGGTVQYDRRNEILKAYDRLAGGGSISRDRTFKDLTQEEKERYLSDINAVDPASQTIRQRLNRQIAVINSFGQNATPEQQALANRRIVSLAQNIDPRNLSESERNEVALAIERQAVQSEQKERDEIIYREKLLKVNEKIEAHLAKLSGDAETEGLEAVQKKIQIELIDKTSGGANILGASPTPDDMNGIFEDYQNAL